MAVAITTLPLPALSPQALATTIERTVRASLPLPVIGPGTTAVVDYAPLMSSEESASWWECVLTGDADGLPDLPLRLSSWQATVQTGRSNYIQCVLPAQLDLVPEIAARRRGEIVITRCARLANGATVGKVMVRSLFSNVFLNEGVRRRTATLNGWSPELPPSAGEAVLTGVQTISEADGGWRVRAAVDWNLRPGMTANFLGREMVVSYINYYVTTDRNQLTQFMDVGSRSDG